jgi:hypothetical protein
MTRVIRPWWAPASRIHATGNGFSAAVKRCSESRNARNGLIHEGLEQAASLREYPGGWPATDPALQLFPDETLLGGT